MAGDADRHETPEAPLPPRPLADLDAEAGPSPPLPWITPFLMAFAGAAAGVVWKYWYAGPGWYSAAVRYFIAAGALIGLGLCTMDRVGRHRPGWIRWAAGMALGGVFIQAATLVVWWFSWYTTGYRLPPLLPVWQGSPERLLVLGVTLVPVGGILAVLADSRIARWFMPVPGFGWFGAMAWAFGVVMRRFGFGSWGDVLGLGNLIGTTQTGWPPWAAGPLVIELSDATMGALFGAALLIAVLRAGRPAWGLGAAEPEAAEPHLPPRPLADTDAEADDLQSRPLTWVTPLIMAVAVGAGGVVWKYWCVGPLWQNAAVRYFIVAGALMGIGVCLMDRVAPRWPRASRWSVGLAAGGTVGVGASAAYVSGPAWILIAHRAVGLAAVFVLCAVLGAVLGALGSHAKRRWRLPLAAAAWLGLSASLARPLPTVQVGGLGDSLGTLAGRYYWPWWTTAARCAASDAALGLLIGLALLLSLWLSEKRPTDR